MLKFRNILLLTLCIFLASCDWIDDKKGRNVEGLIRKLNAPEAVARDSAKEMLGNYLFLKGDLPQLYQAITEVYPDDSLVSKGTKIKLLEVLKGVHAEDTPAFIRTTYPQLPDNPEIQFTALSVLSSMNTPASLEAFRDILLESPPVLRSNAQVLFQPFYESPEHLAHLFPQLIHLVSNKDYQYPVMETLMVGLETGSIEKNSIVDSLYLIREVYRSQKKGLKAYRLDSPRAMNTKNLMEISLRCLSHFPNQTAARQVLDLALEDEDPEIRLSALMARMNAGGNPEPNMMRGLAGDFRTRVPLYLQLAEMEKLENFPDTFLTQLAFAESDLAGWIKSQPNQGRFPKSIQYDTIYKLPATDEAEGGNVYVFKFNMGYGWYAGISGPQPLDTTLVIPSGYMTTSKFEKWNPKHPEEHVLEMTAGE